MAALLALSVSFPTVVYTVLIGVSLIYWAFVVIGAADLDMLGGGHDGALDGALGHHGADVGGGHADVSGGADVGHHADLGDGGDGGDGGDADGGDADDGALGGILAALKLRTVPLTVAVSFLVTFSWLVSVLSMEGLEAVSADLATSLPLRAAVMVLAPVVALLPTSLAVRPLGKLFSPKVAQGNKDLVGKVCVVRTGTVDETFGEATLEDGGAGMVLRVRVGAGEKLKRGESALIVGWDAEREAFTVAAMDDVLRAREGDADGHRRR